MFLEFRVELGRDVELGTPKTMDDEPPSLGIKLKQEVLCITPWLIQLVERSREALQPIEHLKLRLERGDFT